VLAPTYSLAQALLDHGIRVNSVAPGTGMDTADPGNLPGREGG
jgi:NAD(P)-dependent dehydrogenase (short-subunit alcohol dehydrogenase family)